MEHFYQNIQGWFMFDHIYKNMVRIAQEGDHFVEVGCWKGKSTAFMAVEIANSGKKINFDCIDTWKGSDDQKNDPMVLTDTLYEHFLENMKPVEGFYNPRRMTSLDAAASYPDNSLTFVFLDASHDYSNVKADIQAWLPKLKSGGILAGDDYNPTDYPGLVKAVHELLPRFFLNNGWVYEKP